MIVFANDAERDAWAAMYAGALASNEQRSAEHLADMGVKGLRDRAASPVEVRASKGPDCTVVLVGDGDSFTDVGVGMHVVEINRVKGTITLGAA